MQDLVPTIRSHGIYKRIKRKLISLASAEMSPAVEQSLIDVEFAVWFLELSIEGENYVSEKLSRHALDNFRDACCVCGVVDVVACSNDPPLSD